MSKLFASDTTSIAFVGNLQNKEFKKLKNTKNKDTTQNKTKENVNNIMKGHFGLVVAFLWQ